MKIEEVKSNSKSAKDFINNPRTPHLTNGSAVDELGICSYKIKEIT